MSGGNVRLMEESTATIIPVTLTRDQWLDVLLTLNKTAPDVFENVRGQLREFDDTETIRVDLVHHCVSEIEPKSNGLLDFDLDAPVKEGDDGSCYWVQCWHMVDKSVIE